MDSILGVGVLIVIMAGYASFQQEQFAAGHAARDAALLRELHDAADAYLQSEYVALEGCLRTDAALSGDAEQFWRTTPAVHDVGPFVGVPIFRIDGANPDARELQFGTEFAAGCDDPDPDGDGVPYPAPRSLFAAGLLPAEMHGYQYDLNASSPVPPALGTTALNVRFVVRLVNLSGDPALAVLGIQGLLVAVPREPEPGALEAAVAQTWLGTAGLVQSVATGGIGAHRFAGGTGWMIEFCGNANFDVELGGFPVPCLPLLSTDSVLGQVDMTADAAARAGAPLARGDLRVAFDFDDAPPVRTLAGWRAGGPRSARAVFSLHRSRADALGGALYRLDMGIAALNRMQTDVDLNTFGLVNVPYVTGVDQDGDGVVDRGTVFLGPPSGSAEPVEVVGDLWVTGSVQVGEAGAFDPPPSPGLVYGPGGAAVVAFDAAGGVELRSTLGADQSRLQLAGPAVTLATPATGTVDVEGDTVTVRGVDSVEVGAGAPLGTPAVSEIVLDGTATGNDPRLALRHDGSSVLFRERDIAVVPDPAGFFTLDPARTAMRGSTGGARFREAGDLGGNLQTRSLHAAIGRYTTWGFAGCAPGLPAGLGTTAANEQVAVSHGWRADRYSNVRRYRVVRSIDALIGNPVTGLRFTRSDVDSVQPYVGWWMDPVTGDPGPAPALGANAAVQLDSRFTTLTFCDWN